MPRALEPPHPPFPLSRGLVRVLRPVIESPVPPVLDAGQHVPHCRPVARKLVGDHDTRHIRQAFEQPTQEFRGGGLVTTRLHENVEDVPVLSDGPPQEVPHPVYRDEDRVQVPFVARPGPPSA